MKESLILELLNGAFFVLAFCASCVFTHYLWVKREYGYKALTPAIALTCIFYGETWLRGMFWYVRQNLNNGIQMQPSNTLLMLASVTVITGILCSIRVFSPSEWGNRGWVTSLIITIVFLSWSAFT